MHSDKGWLVLQGCLKPGAMKLYEKALAFLLLPAALTAGCSSEDYPINRYEIAKPVPTVEVETPCNDRNPLRNLYWGETHVHTAISADSYLSDVRMMPNDALRYGFGGNLRLPPPPGETICRTSACSSQKHC